MNDIMSLIKFQLSISINETEADFFMISHFRSVVL